jgi:hypothetical protein
MRFKLPSLALGAILLAGCSAAPPNSGRAEPQFNPVVNVKQLMEWVLDPAVDVVWDSVKSIMTENGTREIAPRTDAEWDAVRNGAAVVAEAGNLLMMEGRARDRGKWMQSARALTGAAVEALRAAEAKNPEAVFNAGGKIYEACSACHREYAKHLNASVNTPRHAAAAPAART